MSEQTKDGGQDLHARIMNLPCNVPPGYPFGSELCCGVYRQGHRDARHAAAELAAEHGHALSLARSALEEKTQECDRMMAAINKRDERIAALEEALSDLLLLPVAVLEFHYLERGIGTKTFNAAWLRARSVLNKENGNG